jgi:translation initiation factor IF-2
MSKVRINDLARELEVKSKAILDTLPIVGVTEKKTHSSSLEEHEAEKVRIHLRGSSEAQSPSARSARPLRGEEEIKTKIDLSHISRPGDVLKAITQKKEAVAPPARAAGALRRSWQGRRCASAGKACDASGAFDFRASCNSECCGPSARRQVAPVAEKPAAAGAPIGAPISGTVSRDFQSKRGSGCCAPRVTPPPRPGCTCVGGASYYRVCAPACSAAATRPPAPPAVTGPPQPPAPRMIVPQTGPRPVYKAPPPRPIAPVAQSSGQTSAPAAGTMRPAPGRPVPGQPIFQRPRPMTPGQAVRRVRCDRVSAVPCTLRARLRLVRVRLGLVRDFRLRDRTRPVLVRELRRAGLASAMFRVASKKAR